MGKYSPEIKQAVIDMYKDDMRVEDISDLMGISESTIEDWAKKSGVARKKLQRRKEEPPIAEPEWVEWFKAEWDEVCKMIGAYS